MSKLNELIRELCPHGVCYATLGCVASYATQRVKATEVNIDTYVSVENLLQNKQGKTVAGSVPATGNVIGFKAGDILIGNIRPYLRKYGSPIVTVERTVMSLPFRLRIALY